VSENVDIAAAIRGCKHHLYFSSPVAESIVLLVALALAAEVVR
jgi:hypothetical protein